MFYRSLESIGSELAQLAHDSPEFWIFQRGATSKELSKLERQLGRSLPESLRLWLSKANGGLATSGKVNTDDPREMAQARSSSNLFLSAQEIPSAYERLLQSHPEESRSHFPFIPFMLTTDGGYLAINAEDPSSAVWDAWTDAGPHLWQRLYPSLGSLCSEYLRHHGRIRLAPHEDEPLALPKPYHDTLYSSSDRV